MKFELPAPHSLQRKVLGASTLFIILLTVVIGVFAYILTTEVIKRDARDTLSAIALVREDNLNRWVDEQKRSLVFIASLPGLREQASVFISPDANLEEKQEAVAALSKYFRTIISTTADTYEILLLDPAGKVLLSSIPQHAGVDQRNEAYYQVGLNRTTVTSFYTSSLLQRPTITVSTPLFDPQGKRIGVLAAHLSLAEVDEIIGESSGMGSGGETYLVNSEHQLISSDPLSIQDERSLTSFGIDQALSMQEGSGLYINDRGIPVIGAYEWIDEREVALLVEVPQNEALGTSTWLGLWIIIASIIVIIGSIAIIYAYTRSVLAPIQELTHTASQIATGHLDLRAPVRTDDEIGEMARAFNVMTDELQKSLREQRALNDQLEERVIERTAELTASNRELESFSYTVSHDLRAPLRAISGYAQILQKDYHASLEDGARAMLNKISENAIFMGKLVDGLLAFSRLNRQSLTPQHFSSEQLGQTLTRLTTDLKNDPAATHVQFSIGELSPCYADAILLNQVFANLVSNAVKFSRKKPDAHIEIGSTHTERGIAYFVRDNGVGFDMQYANKLFGVFQRLHHVDEFEGTGVGLAIVQRIVHRHHGEIWAESEPGKGTTFYFTLNLPTEPEYSL